MEDETKEPEYVELARRIVAGDRTAEQPFFSHFVPSLMAILRKRTKGDVQRSEDVCQQACLIVLGRLRDGGIQDISKIAPYFHQTAKFVLFGETRVLAKHNTNADSELIERVLSEETTALDGLLRQESDRAVRILIGELKQERDREILHRYFILEQDKSRICEEMDLSSRRFDGVKSRALQRFKALILESANLLDDDDGGQKDD